MLHCVIVHNLTPVVISTAELILYQLIATVLIIKIDLIAQGNKSKEFCFILWSSRFNKHLLNIRFEQMNEFAITAHK